MTAKLQVAAHGENVSDRFTKRPRILHLIGSSCVGGPEKQILHHAADMLDSPFEIQIGSFKESSEHPEILVEANRRNVKNVCFDSGPRPHILFDIFRFLEQEHIDLLCTHGFKANVLGYLASLRSATRHVAFLRGWTAENKRIILYEKLERFALARSQTVVCVSSRQAEQVRKLRGTRSLPLVIENAMLPPFSRATSAPAPTRAALGIPADAFVFGSVGRLSVEKGHKFLIEAFGELCKGEGKKQSFYLVVVGDGREEEILQKVAYEYGVRESICFAGYQGNCAEWMQLMDCMVQPSLTEGTPNSVLEAMYLDIPVVATAVGGVPALIRDGENGILVPSHDSKALAKAMWTIFMQPELRRSLSKSAAKIGDVYAPERQRALLVDLYQKLSLPIWDSQESF